MLSRSRNIILNWDWKYCKTGSSSKPHNNCLRLHLLAAHKFLQPFTKLKRVTDLDLSRNGFSHFPGKLFDMMPLKTLNLDENPLYCDCLIKYLGMWLICNLVSDISAHHKCHSIKVCPCFGYHKPTNFEAHRNSNRVSIFFFLIRRLATN